MYVYLFICGPGRSQAKKSLAWEGAMLGISQAGGPSQGPKKRNIKHPRDIQPELVQIDRYLGRGPFQGVLGPNWGGKQPKINDLAIGLALGAAYKNARAAEDLSLKWRPRNRH